MTRKIMQFTFVPNTEGAPTTVLSLCDDGTMWTYDLTNAQRTWRPIEMPTESDSHA